MNQIKIAFSSILRVLVALIFFFTLTHVFASEEASKKEASFNVGDMIIEHVLDAHEWHIMTIGHTHVTVPLPILLYDNGALVCFSSSHFHHGHEAYKGYKLMKEAPYKGKIVKVDADNETVLMDASGKALMPIDLSITKNVTSLFISVLLILVIFLGIAKSYKTRVGKAPKGLQSFIEPLIIFVRDDIAKPSIGKKYERFLPFILTLFFFILINNLLGLVPFFPGGANLTGNISVTLVMALFTFVITTYNSNKNYWLHIFWAPGVPWWLKVPIPLMPIVELMGVFTKPFVLMVRLFANITAGHIIILGFMSLIFIFGQISLVAGLSTSIVSIAFSVFMSLLELLVAFIQAYVFALLSALYFGMAMEEHH